MLRRTCALGLQAAAPRGKVSNPGRGVSRANPIMATEETVSHIAKTLGEVEEIPLTQIAGVVRALGEQEALGLLKETLDIEEKGGMMLADGSRRRSPGGVFFQLARKRLPPEERKNIFRERKSSAAAPADPAASPNASTQQPGGDASRLARRRVVEVIPARAGKGRSGAFTPPELPSALTRARIRQQVNQAIAPLPIEEQYHLLLDLLADIHDRVLGGAHPPPSEATARASRGGARRR